MSYTVEDAPDIIPEYFEGDNEVVLTDTEDGGDLDKVEIVDPYAETDAVCAIFQSMKDYCSENALPLCESMNVYNLFQLTDDLFE